MTSMQQIPTQLTELAIVIASYRWKGGMVVDNFAGGGGASTGIAQATGRSPDIAVNHDEDALAMHEENHPDTVHYRESVWQVNVPEATGRRPVLFGWFSPDCTHFSVAKGGKPVKKNIRGLAWVAKKWAGQSDMAVLFIENVKEFQTWGPLVAKRCKKTGRVIRLIPTGTFDKKGNEKMLEQVSAPGEHVPYREQALVPDKKRSGQTFRRFVNQLRGMGYTVEWRGSMVAADYGVPTSRSRFFLIARKDGLPIVWPEQTHGDPQAKDRAIAEKVRAKILKPWATAGDHLDFSISCRSIFDPDRPPLAEATMRRIAKGIQRFVIDAGDDAFLVKTNHAYDAFRGQSLDAPIQTITGKLGTGLVDVKLQAVAGIKFRGQSPGWAVRLPLPTITSGAGAMRPAGAAHAMGIVAATLVQTGYGERPGQEPRAPGLQKPLGTVVAGGIKHAAVEAHLMPVSADFITTIDHGSVKDPSTGLDEPLTTTTSKARHVRVAAMLKHFTGVVGQDLHQPCPTITATDHNSVVEATLEVAHLQREFGNSIGQPADEPVGTIMPGGGGKTSLVTTKLKPVKSDSILMESTGEYDGLDTGFSSAAGSRCSKDSSRRNDLEGDEPHQQGSVEAQGPGKDGHLSGGDGIPERAVRVPGEALSGLGSSRGVSQSGRAGTGGVRDQPYQRDQGRQSTLQPGGGVSLCEPVSRLSNETAAGDSPEDSRGTEGGSQGAKASGDDLQSNSRTPELLSNDGIQGRREQVKAFLIEFYSTGGQWCDLNKPINTIPASDRFALVTIKGVDYQIVDIGMRMLEPHELYRCQGFPEGYKHQVIRGKKLPKHKQVRMVGNSVPPGLACALVEANIPQWALEA